ncbi:hypothetical protein [Lysobacter sp. CA199]|uniref:hypothetical protein n=1 Tax=Lysobacter sp. CA199 TaxID=3455608 RepID=UPI003F8D53D4
MSKDMKAPKYTRTPLQKVGLRDVVVHYKWKCPGMVVRDHNEWSGVAKACPSFDVFEWLKAEGL